MRRERRLPDVLAMREARDQIAGRVGRTPTVTAASRGERAGVPVHLKLEQRQVAGSFKSCGASHATLCLSVAERTRSVVGVSTGNHGRVLAQAAKGAGVRWVLCMSSPADSLDGGIGLDNQFTYRMVRDWVDGLLLGGEMQIAQATRHAN